METQLTNSQPQPVSPSQPGQAPPPPPIQGPPPGGIGDEESSHNKIFLIIGAVIGIIILILVALFILMRLSSSRNERVTLRYWGLWEDPSVFQGVIDDFQRQHPNITILYEKQDIKTFGKYIDRVRTRIINNTDVDTPDIFRYHNSWLFQLQDVLHPFTADFVNKTGLATDFYPVVKKDLLKDGGYYGIPLHFDTLAMFTNNTLFQDVGLKVPSTLDDVTSTAEKITVPPGAHQGDPITTAGIALEGYDNIAHASDILSGLMLQNGADLLAPTGPKRANAVQGLDYFACVQHDNNNGNNTCVKVWDPNGDNSRLAFAKGNLAMFFGYSWDVPLIKAANPGLDFSIHPFPHLAQGSNLTIASYWVEGISIKTKHPAEAEQFLEYLSSPQVLEKLYAEEIKEHGSGELYPRKSMAKLLNDSKLSPFLSQANSATSTLYSSDTYDDALNAALNAYMGNAVKRILNGVSADTAIDDWGNGVAAVLKNVQH